MPSTEKVLAKHPVRGKQGTRISKTKYDLIRAGIVRLLTANGELAFVELVRRLQQQLGKSFDGSVGWYITTVKLDLETRRIIERVPKSSPQRLRMKS